MKRHHLIAIALFLATILAYEPLRKNDFVGYDDSVYVTENPHVQAGLAPQSIVWAFNLGHASNWHPLTWLSHMLDVTLWGLDPRGHHLTSLALHAASAVVLFLLLRRTTGSQGKSAFVAAVFALHPQHVESVAWSAERKDVLSALLGLLAIAAWCGWTRRGGGGRYALALVLFALALAAKPMLVTLPFLLLLFDLWPLRRWRLGGPDREAPADGEEPRARPLPLRALLREKAPFFALAALSCAMTFAAQSRGRALASVEELPISFRLGHAAWSYVAYLVKAVWPSRLAVFYPYPVGAMSITKSVACALGLLAATAAVLRGARARPWLAVGWLWWLGMLLPVIGIVQVGEQAMGDRYSYLPLVGLSIAVAWGAGEIAQRWASGRVVLTAAGLGLLAFWAGRTRAHVRLWKDEETLFRHAAAVTQGNYVAHRRIAFALTEKGRFAEAMEEYATALGHNPNDSRAYNDLGRLHEKQGRIEEAILNYRRSVEIDPEHGVAHANLASALDAEERSDEAFPHFERALELEPENPHAHNSYGIALAKRGRFEEAIEHFEVALQWKPDFGDAWLNRGMMLANLGLLPDAIESVREGIRLRPDRSDAQAALDQMIQDLEARESEPPPR